MEIAGLSEAPEAGSPFFAVADERMARELVEQRKAEARAKAAAPVQKVSLENLFDQIQAGERKELALIVKADVQGSVEAVKASLEKLSNDEVNVRVIHGGVGAINESDVMLAASSNAIIVGFNVRPDAAARDGAIRQNVDMRMYRVIYDCIDEIEAAMKGMLAPKFREVVLGHAEVRQTYKVSSVGTVAGCYVQDGKIVRSLLRPGGPGRHRDPRGRPGLPEALQGRRQGSGRELRVRPHRGEVQRHQGRRHHRSFHYGGDSQITGRSPAPPQIPLGFADRILIAHQGRADSPAPFFHISAGWPRRCFAAPAGSGFSGCSGVICIS